jgi:hypothetical protein
MKAKLLGVAILCLFGVGITRPANAQAYTVTDLGFGNGAVAADINNAGQVVGWGSPSGGAGYQALLWNAGTVTP